MSELTVPLFDTQFGTAELDAVAGPLRDGWLTMGPRTEEFEREFAAAIGARHVVAVSNCTAALHLSLLAHSIGPSDEVLCPTLTFVATANAIRYVGARVVFCESCGPANLNIDPVDVEAKITPRTRAVIVVHFAGYPADMPRLMEICKRHNLVLIEDVAHACISTLQKRACGTWGECGCFSFFSNKNITCGEGGAITTNDDEVAKKLRLLRSHGMTTTTIDRHKGHAFTYDVVETGYNYRLDEMRSSLLLSQLSHLDDYLEKRQAHVEAYRDLLADVPVAIPDFDWSQLANPTDRVAHHIFPVLLPEDCDRGFVMQALRDRGVQTSIHYPPIHKFQSFSSQQSDVDLPRTDQLAARELTLPLFPLLSEEQIRHVATSLSAALQASSVPH